MSIADARSWFERGHLDEARRAARKLVKRGQSVGAALQLLGYIEGRLGRLAEAAGYLAQAVKVSPASVESWYYLGVAHQKLGRHDEAVAALQEATRLAPGFFEAAHDLGLALHALERYADAERCFETAVAIAPGALVAHLNRGINFSKLRRYAEELACYEIALAIEPRHQTLLENYGHALCQVGAYARAVPVLASLLEIDGHNALARSSLLHAKSKLCDWDGLDEELGRLRRDMVQPGAGFPPFVLLGLPSSPAEQLQAAQAHAAGFSSLGRQPLEPGPAKPAGRIRLAYLSSNFGPHPVAQSMARVFELHDGARFELTAISLASKGTSAMRRRLEAACERFIDADGLSDRDAAELISAMNIDILVDLNGHTDHARPAVLAYRPAPIQIGYLGYPGTSGAPFIDYLVADQTVIPRDQRAFYSEKIIYLPDSYHPTDSLRATGAGPMTRADAGLADGDFVLCCFNDGYKITPAVFGIWMRLLARIDRSVLWLRCMLPQQQANLRQAATGCGISAQRLVFAPFVDAGAHASRLQLADLFLDTLPYNAHATAIDALWAGVPVITCTGSTFAGRVASSLLQAVGAPELITASAAEYEALVVRLALDRPALQALRERLARDARTSPLFDSARYTRSLEQGLLRVWSRHQAGRAAGHVFVGDHDSRSRGADRALTV